MSSHWPTSHRTCTCGVLRETDAGRKVTLCGWTHSYRDHGGLVFVDLRDRTGLVQIVFDPERNAQAHELAQQVRAEWVLQAEGEVRKRLPGMANPKLATGAIEVVIDSLRVFSRAKTPPFEIADGIETREEVRLRHRYVDLRRPEMQRALEVRHRAIFAVRKHLDSLGFLEIETPVLGRSTPEGARDFLVPSRYMPGAFFALPQSPQMYKQLLMIGGADRYFQIARCLRDEDPRADRQFEFTQVDVEMSFASQEDVLEVTEGFIAAAFKEALGMELERPFPRLGHADALLFYGNDKPDLRFDLRCADVTGVARETEFRVFRSCVEAGGVVRALRAPGWAKKSRRELDLLTEDVKALGAGGLAWLKLKGGKRGGPFIKFATEEQLARMVEAAGGRDGDLVLFIADAEGVACACMAYLRNRIGAENGLKDPGRHAVTWVVDFPLFKWNEDEGRWDSEHHPFTSPHPDDLALIEEDPARVRSLSYDLVVNGYECASGSVRIHDADVQAKIFSALKLTREQVEHKFGFFLEALRYGTPPHAGIAAGVDRIVTIMVGKGSIREVIAFPKTQRGQDLMTGAPAEVEAAQLKELGITIPPKASVHHGDTEARRRG